MSDEILNSVELATELTIAWLGNQNNRISAEEVPAFLRSMHSTITELSSASTAPEVAESEVVQAEYPPAVTVRKSLASKDHILSMIDGKPYRALRRHLASHGLTAEEYRARYGLKPDYPMVAPAYSEARRQMAHKIGLGAKGRAARTAAPETPPKSARAPRKPAPKQS